MTSVKEDTAIYNLADSVRKKIGRLDKAKLEILIDDLTGEFKRREQEDLTLCVSNKKLRYTDRMFCSYFKKKCRICNVVSLTLKPRECVCGGCGKFQQGEHMSSAKILNARFKVSEENQKGFLRVLSHFCKNNRRVSLQEGMENFAINGSIRKSQSINSAPMQGGCPLCGK